jgi:hypothetical protein
MPERVLPREFPTPPLLIIPLSNTELLELGTFTAIWGQLDFLLLITHASLAKTTPDAALVTIENLTTGQRVGLVSKLCRLGKENAIKKAIRKTLDENGGLIDERNHVIHGLWGIEWIRDPPKTTAVCSKGDKKPIPASKLAELSNRAAALCNKLGDLAGQLDPQHKTWVGNPPSRLFFGSGDPQGHAPPPWPPE